MTPVKLSDEEISKRLETLPEWSNRGGHIERELKFPDFVTAFGFMSQAALVSERLNHHPEWSNVYSRVYIKLSTHDAGGVTDLDLNWAKQINSILDQHSK